MADIVLNDEEFRTLVELLKRIEREEVNRRQLSLDARIHRIRLEQKGVPRETEKLPK
jgi:predicted NAD/FAD-binding protein